MDANHLYKDIQARTNGEIYIGVVGPVRTGKSTFIKRFMELLVLPAMEDENMRNLSRDELPQSAAGKTIMTTSRTRNMTPIRMGRVCISTTAGSISTGETRLPPDGGIMSSTVNYSAIRP